MSLSKVLFRQTDRLTDRQTDRKKNRQDRHRKTQNSICNKDRERKKAFWIQKEKENVNIRQTQRKTAYIL